MNQKLKVLIKTLGCPMDEGRYDLDSYDHECVLYCKIRSYGNPHLSKAGEFFPIPTFSFSLTRTINLCFPEKGK